MQRPIVGLKAAFVLAGLLVVPRPTSAQGTDLAASLLRDEAGRVPGEIAGFRLVSARQDEAIHFVFTLDPARPVGENLVEVTLTPRDEARPALARTASFNIEYRGPMVGGRPAPALRPLVDAVVATVMRNDPGGLLIAPPKPKALGEGGEVPAHVEAVDRASAWVGLALVALFLLLLPWTGKWVARDLWNAWPGDAALGPRSRVAGWVALGAVACGAALRLVLPHMPVMYYMGYHLADTAARLEGIPKYGPGALALYHLVFQVTRTDHIAMMYANSVLGALTPLAGGALLSRLGVRGWGMAGAVALLALTPLFVRDATTESLLVPTTLWLLLGLAFALRARQDRRTLSLGASLLHLLLAMLSRPEAVVLAPLGAGLLLPLVARGPRQSWSLVRIVLWALAAAILALRFAQLAIALDVEFARGNNPVLRDPAGLVALVPDLWRRNVLVWPHLFPAAVTALGVCGVLTGPRRKVALAVVVLSLAWIAASLVDLPYVSIQRVQVPGAVFWTLAAGVGVAGACRLLARRRTLLVGGLTLLVLVTTLSAAWTVPALWAPTNADDEERLLREAQEAIPPDQPFILVRRGYDDVPVERLHLYYPDYWFEPPAREGLAVGPDWFERTDTAGRPAYFLLGTRCYMRVCGESGLHPACRRMREKYRLEPVIERTVPIRGLPVDRPRRPDQDLDFPWCLAAQGEMRIGLYRVTGASGGS